jgi:hypothetical protein
MFHRTQKVAMRQSTQDADVDGALLRDVAAAEEEGLELAHGAARGLPVGVGGEAAEDLEDDEVSQDDRRPAEDPWR